MSNFFALTWNPDKKDDPEKWDEKGFREHIVEPFLKNGYALWDWHIGTNLDAIKKGDICFLLQQGRKGGFYGLAVAEKDSKKVENNKGKAPVKVFYFKDPKVDFLISADHQSPSQILGKDHIYASGTRIESEVAEHILSQLFEASFVDDYLLNSQVSLQEDIQEEFSTLYALALTKRRSVHHLFTKNVKKLWDYKCAVTGLSNETFLHCSHIKPYKDCTPNEASDAYNGLYLSLNLDKAFDNFLVTFDEEGRIKISKHLLQNNGQLEKLGIHKTLKILKPLNSKQCEYLQWHNKKFEEKALN